MTRRHVDHDRVGTTTHRATAYRWDPDQDDNEEIAEAEHSDLDSTKALVLANAPAAESVLIYRGTYEWDPDLDHHEEGGAVRWVTWVQDTHWFCNGYPTDDPLAPWTWEEDRW